MELLVVIAFIIIMIGFGIVVKDAIGHANLKA